MDKKVPSLRFNGFEDEWEQDAFGKILFRVDERGFAYLPLLTASINYGMILKDSKKKVKSLESFKRVLPNDFVLHLSSFNSGLAFSKFEGLTSPIYNVLRFRNLDKHHPNFWMYVFKSSEFINSLVPLTYGLRQGKNINLNELEKNLLKTTSKHEQQKISHLFNSLDSYLSLHKRKYDFLKNIKSTLLSKMFPDQNSKFPNIRFSGFTHAWEQELLGDMMYKYS
ncbi:hypothetical protein ACXYRQ_01775, partial [Mycoplasma sp. 394]